VLKLAQTCGERLLSAQLTHGPYRGGFPPNDAGAPIAGFSHGAAGIACSLSRLYEIWGDVRFREAADQAFFSERSALGISASSIDAQDTGDRDRERLISWCHGAPGMALARLDALSNASSEALELEADVAIGITESFGLRTLDSLCCGNLGRMETLLVASSTPGRKRFAQLAETWTATVVGRARKSGSYSLRSNAQSGKILFNPPLFHGVAGVGYQLLRLARPPDIPCLLLWR